MTYVLGVEQAEAIIHVWNCAGVSIRFNVGGNMFCLQRDSLDDPTGMLYIKSPGSQLGLETDRVGIVRKKNERPHLVVWLVPSFCIDFCLEAEE